MRRICNTKTNAFNLCGKNDDTLVNLQININVWKWELDWLGLFVWFGSNWYESVANDFRWDKKYYMVCVEAWIWKVLKDWRSRRGHRKISIEMGRTCNTDKCYQLPEKDIWFENWKSSYEGYNKTKIELKMTWMKCSRNRRASASVLNQLVLMIVYDERFEHINGPWEWRYFEMIKFIICNKNNIILTMIISHNKNIAVFIRVKQNF